MKRIVNLLAVACMAGLFAACTGQGTSGGSGADQDSLAWIDSAIIKPIGWGGSDLGAIAFIGYFTNTQEALAKVQEHYGFTPRGVEMGGDECYLIIPRSIEASVEVLEYSYDVTTNEEREGNSVFAGVGTPFLLRCNLSDILANSRVIIILDGKRATLEPRLDLGDGSIVIPGVTPAGQGTWLDISSYPQAEAGAPGEQTIVYDCAPGDEMKPEAHLKDGKVTVLVSQPDMRKFYERTGKIRWGKPTEKSFEVEGLQGTCIRIAWGNWGNEVNPLLCMLMEDGGVQILDLISSIDHYDHMASAPLPGLTHIVSFKQDGDESGTSMQAVDRQGEAHDIPVFAVAPSRIVFPEETPEYPIEQELRLTPDWKIMYGTSVAGEVWTQRYKGTFFGTPYLADEGATGSYTYTFTSKQGDKPTEGGMAMEPLKEKVTGSFTIRMVKAAGMGYDYIVEVTGGNIRFSSSTDKPRFVVPKNDE